MSTSLRVSVLKVKPGDRISTSTGMREVLDITDHGAFVTVGISDPANVQGQFRSLLHFNCAASVLIERGKRLKK